MNLPFRQRGLSPLTMLIIMLVAVFFATCALKILPLYMEHSTVERAVATVVDRVKAGTVQPSEIKTALKSAINVNMIDAITIKDIKVTTKSGTITVDARYERRISLMFNIDVVIKFDQLIYEFSQSKKKN